jgi:hypothetical protein
MFRTALMSISAGLALTMIVATPAAADVAACRTACYERCTVQFDACTKKGGSRDACVQARRACRTQCVRDCT